MNPIDENNTNLFFAKTYAPLTCLKFAVTIILSMGCAVTIAFGIAGLGSTYHWWVVNPSLAINQIHSIILLSSGGISAASLIVVSFTLAKCFNGHPKNSNPEPKPEVTLPQDLGIASHSVPSKNPITPVNPPSPPPVESVVASKNPVKDPHIAFPGNQIEAIIPTQASPPNLSLAKVVVLESLNLAPDGQVEWNGYKLFSPLFEQTIPVPEVEDMPIPEMKEKPTCAGSGQQIGRSVYNPDQNITCKKRKLGEEPEKLQQEAVAQSFLSAKKLEWGLKSNFPFPIYYDEEELYYTNPLNYHTYLTDIDTNDDFTQSLANCAYDLGILLRKGIAYPQLISIFHDVGSEPNLKKGKGTLFRVYTAFPNRLGNQAIFSQASSGQKTYHSSSGGMLLYGYFPGEIENSICSPNCHLYPNLGKSGLRDLGDFTTIADYIKLSNRLNIQATFESNCSLSGFNDATCSSTLAFAHFLSLYQIVFLLIIAKRAQRINNWDQQQLAESFSQAVQALLTTFLELDPSQSQKLQEEITKSFDHEKFSLQIRFCFTTEDRSKIWQHEERALALRCDKMVDLKDNPSTRFPDGIPKLPTLLEMKKIWGENVKWVNLARRDCVLESYKPEKGFAKDALGNNSGPNPLVEGMQFIFNATYFALKHKLGHFSDPVI